MALSKAVQKVNEYTKNNSGFFDLAEPYGLFRKLKVEGKSQLREIRYCHGGSLPSHEYLPKSRQKPVEPNIELENLLSDSSCRHICFVGPAGIGKTTLTRSIARGALEGIYRGLSNVEAVLFLHCRDYKPGDIVSAGEFLFGKADLTTNEIEDVFKLAREYPEKVLFILDSLDTLQYNVDGVYKFITLYEKACPEAILWNFLSGNLFPGCRAITSSREYTIRNYKGEVRPSKVITILGLTKKSIMDIVVGYVGEIEAKEFMHYLDTKALSLRPLCTTPVILVYSLIGYKASPGFTPTTSTGCLIVVLQSIIRSQHTHHEDILGVMHKLQELAYNGTRDGRVLFTSDDLHEVGLKPQDVTDLTIFAPGGFTEKLLQGQSRLFFSHQTLQEVFSALWISKMVKDCFKKFVKSLLNTPRFVVVRKFIYGVFFDQEVNSILSKDLHQGDNDLRAKIEILREDIQSQLIGGVGNSALLELFISLSEAKDGISDIIKSSLHEVSFSVLPLSSSDVFTIGSVVSQCDHLDWFYMFNCSLDASSLNLLGSQLKESKVKLRSLLLRENGNMGIDGISAVGRIVTRNDVEELNLAECCLSAKQLQTLADSTKDATKLRSFHLRFNDNMGIDGISAVGIIVTRNDVEELILTGCCLSAKQLLTLADLTKDATKLQVVDLGGALSYPDKHCEKFEHEKIRAVGNLLSNVTAEVRLCTYEISDEDVACLQNILDKLGKEGLRVKIGKPSEKKYLSAKSQVEVASNVLYPAAPFATQKEDQDVKADFSAATEDLKPSARESTSEDLKEDEGARISDDVEIMSDVEVSDRASTSTASEKSEKRKLPEGNKTANVGESSSEAKKEQDVSMVTEDGRVIVSKSTRKVIGLDGGVITVGGCIVTFPKKSLRKKTEIVAKAEINRAKWPKGYFLITPMLYVDGGENLCEPASVRMRSWCVNGESEENKNATVDLLHRLDGSDEWNPIDEFPFTNKTVYEFKCTNFSPYAFGILEYFFGSRSLVIQPCLFSNRLNMFAYTFTISEEMVLETIQKHMKESGYKLEKFFSTPTVKRNDEISIRTRCVRPNSFSCEPEEMSFKIESSMAEAHRYIEYLDVNSDGQVPTVITLESSILNNDVAIVNNQRFKYKWQIETDDDDDRKNAKAQQRQERTGPTTGASFLESKGPVTIKDCSINLMAGNSGTQSVNSAEPKKEIEEPASKP